MMITNQQKKKHWRLLSTILSCSALLIGILATSVVFTASGESTLTNGTPNYTGDRHARIIEAIMANSTYTYEAPGEERKPHSSAMCVEAALVNIGFFLPPDLAGGEIILTKTNGEKVLDAVAKYEGSVVIDHFTRRGADIQERFSLSRTAVDVQLTEDPLLRGVLIVNTEEGVMQFALPEQRVVMGSCPEI